MLNPRRNPIPAYRFYKISPRTSFEMTAVVKLKAQIAAKTPNLCLLPIVPGYCLYAAA